MKPEQVFERRQSAGRMEAIMVMASVIGAIAAIPAFFSHGWVAGLTLLLLSLLAFALSRVFDLLGDLLFLAARSDEGARPTRLEKSEKTL